VDGKSTVWLKILFKAVLLMPCSCLTLKHACSPPVSYDDSNTCLLDIGIIHVNRHFLISVINMMVTSDFVSTYTVCPLVVGVQFGEIFCDRNL